MQPRRLRSSIRAALVAALVAAGALIALPFGPVPVTLQVLVVAVATLVLTPAEVGAALVLYLAVGAAGLPVFSGGGGGIGVLLGPTGGFLVGFLAGATAGAAVRASLLRDATSRQVVVADAAAMLVLLAVTYALGWAWFALATGTAPAQAFVLAVAPFLLIDLAKVVGAFGVARALRAARVLS